LFARKEAKDDSYEILLSVNKLASFVARETEDDSTWLFFGYNKKASCGSFLAEGTSLSSLLLSHDCTEKALCQLNPLQRGRRRKILPVQG
jgi:hypothetical protein